MTNDNTQTSQQSRKGFWDVYEPNNHKRIYVTVFNSAEAASYAENGYKVVEQASQQVPSVRKKSYRRPCPDLPKGLRCPLCGGKYVCTQPERKKALVAKEQTP